MVTDTQEVKHTDIHSKRETTTTTTTTTARKPTQENRNVITEICYLFSYIV